MTGKMGRESGQGKGGKGTFIIGNIYKICIENRFKGMHENWVEKYARECNQLCRWLN